MGPFAKGGLGSLVHFAQINERDGFFSIGREADEEFSWIKLVGKKVLVDHGGQPFAMFKYAMYKEGVDIDSLEIIDAGSGTAMDAAFRRGEGDYIHQQGPAPQQLELDGQGYIVGCIGVAIGPVAFSSLFATGEWLQTDMAKAFMRAYTKAADM